MKLSSVPQIAHNAKSSSRLLPQRFLPPRCPAVALPQLPLTTRQPPLEPSVPAGEPFSSWEHLQALIHHQNPCCLEPFSPWPVGLEEFRCCKKGLCRCCPPPAPRVCGGSSSCLGFGSTSISGGASELLQYDGSHLTSAMIRLQRKVS